MATGLLPIVTEQIKKAIVSPASADGQYTDGFIGGAPWPASPEPQMRQGMPPEAAQMVAQAPQQQGWMPLSVSDSEGSGGLFGGLFDDKERMARIGLALNAMTLRPDAGFAQAMNDQLKTSQQMRLMKAQANKTVDYMISKGMVSQEQADMLRQNPELVKTIFTSSLTQDRKETFTPVSGADLNKKYGTAAYDPKRMYNLGSSGKVTQIGDTAPNFKIDFGREDETQKGWGKELPERVSAFMKAGAGSRSLLNNLSNFSSQLESMKDTGKYEENLLQLRQFARGLGIPVDKVKLAQGESLQAAGASMVADQLRMNKGPQTDFDAKFTATYMPTIGKEKESNRQIISYMTSVNTLNTIYANEAAKARGQKFEPANKILTELETLQMGVPAVAKTPDGKWVQFSSFFNNVKQADPSIDNMEIVRQWKKRTGK